MSDEDERLSYNDRLLKIAQLRSEVGIYRCKTERLEAIIEAASVFVADMTGSCPHDMHDWQHPKGCMDYCAAEPISKCWALWFKHLAEEAAE